MGQITVARRLNTTADAAWAVIDDFPNVARWSSGVASSKSTNHIERGVGAERRCTFDAKGKQWANERVVERTDDRIVISVYETNAPFDRFDAAIQIRPDGDGCVASFTADVDVKFGLLGKLMEAVMIRPQFRKLLAQILDDLEAASKQLVKA